MSAKADKTRYYVRWLADMPIRRKLTVIAMAVTSVALLVAGLGVLAADFWLFRNYLERDLSALSEIIADNSTAALSFDDPAAARETLSALRARSRVDAACIFDAGGVLFARYVRPGTSVACPPVRPDHGVRFTSQAVTVVRPIDLAGRRIGTFTLQYDLGELYGRMRLYGAVVLAILLAAVLVAAAISSELRDVIAGPISELAAATTAVSRTRDYRIRARRISDDELGGLVDVFNDMLAGIQTRDQELRDALTGRELALHEAREARDFLRTTLASIGDAVISTDRDMRIAFANAVACELTGWDEKAIVGQALGDVLHIADEQTGARLENLVDGSLRDGLPQSRAGDVVLTSRDGKQTPIDESAAPIRGDNGILIGCVLVLRDISERRRADRELRAAREQLQFVTDTMAAAVAHVGRDLRFVWVSRHYADRFALPPSEFSGRGIAEMLGDKVMTEIRPYIERVLSGDPVQYEVLVEYPAAGPRWVRASYVPTFDPAGIVTGWVAEVADVTALKQAQEEVIRVNADLKKSNEQLARSNEDLERFAFAASHDMQEPLRMITTYVQLLTRSLPPGLASETRQYVGHILDGAARMRVLLIDLLAYSEVGAEPEEPPRAVELDQVIAAVRENLKIAIEESGASIRAEPLPRVSGHFGRFVQVFQNLIGNAIKYRGPDAPEIRVWGRQEHGRHLLAVADNGMGIDPEYHNRIFGVFKRLHGKKIPGTGIGLAICQRVVERYGGRIWVESRPGEGATFYFTLPSSSGE